MSFSFYGYTVNSWQQHKSTDVEVTEQEGTEQEIMDIEEQARAMALSHLEHYRTTGISDATSGEMSSGDEVALADGAFEEIEEFSESPRAYSDTYKEKFYMIVRGDGGEEGHLEDTFQAFGNVIE